MKSILKILKVTDEAYEAMLFDTYISWCMDWVSNYENELQKLVASPAINKWFRMELAKLEKSFVEETLPYADIITRDVAREQYADFTEPIFRRFPKPLIEQAKKPLTINNDPSHAN